MDGESRANHREADQVLEILTGVLALKELSVLEVGVVSPYAAQVRALRRKLQAELPRKLKGTDVDFTGGIAGMTGLRALEIASVDAFQGREKELIVFSAVRSNAKGRVGFLADWRRLNVMITRARKGLIVVGNMDTLRCDPTWAKWLEWADEQGLVMRGPVWAGQQPRQQQQQQQQNGQDVNGTRRETSAASVRSLVEPDSRENSFCDDQVQASPARIQRDVIRSPLDRFPSDSDSEESVQELYRHDDVAEAEEPIAPAMSQPVEQPMHPMLKGVLGVLIGALVVNLYVRPLMDTMQQEA